MEISYTLIVALMFITILSFGLAGLLTSLADIINNKNNISVSMVHLAWIVVLLIIHFNMAWHAVLITNIDTWSYDAFIIIVLGPMLAFFATSIISPGVSDNETPEILESNYLDIKQRFFVIFGLIQIWTLCADYILQRGITGSGIFNVTLLLLAITMYNSNKYQTHFIGVAIASLLYITAIVLRSLAVIN